MLPLERYLSDMEVLREDNRLLYDNMPMDIYYLGVVLRKKYRLLKISYTIFMIGIILVVAAFIYILLYIKYMSSHPMF